MGRGDAIEVGIHLPQAGPAASPDSLRRAAVQAEQLGFSDIWVSDHIAIPRDAPYPPSKYIYEPLTALTWAAAATERIRLGTTVLVVPLRRPVVLAKILSSLDLLSGGRLIVGAACGWLREEFDALGVPYEKRGPWTDESLDLIRRCWQDDPIDFDGSVTGAHLVDIRTKPQPTRRIPIWIGGHSPPALRRAIERGDGWHGGFQSAEQLAPLIDTLREGRPEESFTLSLRTRWDALADSDTEILKELEECRSVGIQHFVSEPRQRDLDSWLRCGEALARLVERVN
jgi:probable F420-dependent oxidoreductase